MKKRLVAILLSAVMVLSMAACGTKEEAPVEDAVVEEDAPEVEEAPVAEEEAPAENSDPNAATRSDGFKSVFADYPDVEIVELTGTSVEEHYAQFESALMAYDDMIGAFGLYSAATVGMINAKLAAGSDVPLTSIDNDKPILQAIYEGNVLGSCCYSASVPAFYALSGMINLLNGVEIPSAYFYENRVVTKDNVEEMFEHY